MDKKILSVKEIIEIAKTNPASLIEAGLFYVITFYLNEIHFQGEHIHSDRIDTGGELNYNGNGTYGYETVIDKMRINIHYT